MARQPAPSGSRCTPRPTPWSSTSATATSSRASPSRRRASSTWRWRSGLPELRLDPITGLRVIVAGDRGGSARRVARHPRAAADRPGHRPVRRGQRGPDAARGLRAQGRRRAGLAGLARAGRAEPLSRRSSRASPTRAATRSAPGAASPTCSFAPGAGRPRADRELAEPGLVAGRARGRRGRGRDVRLARAHPRARGGLRLRARDRERGARGRRVAAAHPRAALRAAVRARRRSPASASASPRTGSAPRAATCSPTCSRRRSPRASGSWSIDSEAVVLCPFAARVPFHMQVVPRRPVARF